MKIRSILFAALVGFVSTFAFAAEQAATLSEDVASQVRAAAQSGDTRALAQLVANNPGLATQIASVAAAANPAAAATIAATVSAVAPAQAASIAAAVTTVAPAQAANIAAAVATIVPTQAAAVAASCSAAAPSQSGAVTAAVSAAAPASTSEIVSSVATATNTSTESVQAQSTANASAGQSAAANGAMIAQNVVMAVSQVNMTPNLPTPTQQESQQQETPSNVIQPDGVSAAT